MSLWICAVLVCAGEPEVAMSLEGAIVHRPAHFTHRQAFLDLPETVVLLADVPADPAKLAAAFAGVASADGEQPGMKLPASMVATGPVLDGPDQVLPRRLVRRGNRLELEILHTAVRLQGVQLRRNIIWRPMVEVPLELPPGLYQLDVTWRAVAGLPDGKPLDAPPLIRSVKFAIEPGKRP